MISFTNTVSMYSQSSETNMEKVFENEVPF